MTAGTSSYILTQTRYDGFGRAYETIDNGGSKTRTFYYPDGRQQYVVDNYHGSEDPNATFDPAAQAGGGTNNNQNSVTGYVYNAADLLSDQIAYDPDQSVSTPAGPVTEMVQQDTHYVYAMDLDTSAWDTPVPDGSLLRATVYPDSSDAVTEFNGSVDFSTAVAVLDRTDTTDAAQLCRRHLLCRRLRRDLDRPERHHAHVQL